MAAAERELRQRTNQTQGSDGEEVIRGDEVHCWFTHSQITAIFAGDFCVCACVFFVFLWLHKKGVFRNRTPLSSPALSKKVLEDLQSTENTRGYFCSYPNTDRLTV